MAEVVVLPCMPAMTMPRLLAMIAASASARRTSRLPASRALTRMALSFLIAEEKITMSASAASSLMLHMKAEAKLLQAIDLE